MKIYSWNIWFRNKNFDRAFDFIANSDWDIFCLQEIPEEFLPRLRSLPCYVTDAPEIDRAERNKSFTTRLVTLSKHPIASSQDIRLRDAHPRNPRNRRFVSLMVKMRVWNHVFGNRHALAVDVDAPEGRVRVFNIHPALFPPAERIEEFQEVMAHRSPDIPSVVCGDFNTLESAHIAPFNWLLGGTLGDAVLAKRERKLLEREFERQGLVNPLRKKTTHAASRSQLDHILVPKEFLVRTAHVSKDAVGSDHRAIYAEIGVQ